MAKTPVNSGLEQVRGRIGGWVYRLLEGETIIAPRPQRATDDNPTETQKGVRETFRRAASYAKAVFDDPVRKAANLQLALKRGFAASRLFAFLVQDYAKPPEITEVNTSGYARQAGNPIDVFATDNGEVVGVHVALKEADGTVLEQGAAVVADAGWRYVATTTIPPGDPITVEVTATDRPGGRGIRSVIV